MSSPITQYFKSAQAAAEALPAQRVSILESMANYIAAHCNRAVTVHLNFICTHNSRRSHMAQLWAWAASHRYGLSHCVRTYSGGTEATAFYPRAVRAMENAGWLVQSSQGHKLPDYNGYGQTLSMAHPKGIPSAVENQGYLMRFSPEVEPMLCYSKVFSAAPNPAKDFAAIMTCSDADEACPIIPGAAARFSLPYDDPKAFDKHPDAQKAYDERCLQIASEMLYTFALAAKMLEKKTSQT